MAKGKPKQPIPPVLNESEPVEKPAPEPGETTFVFQDRTSPNPNPPFGYGGLKCKEWFADDCNGVGKIAVDGRVTLASHTPILPCKVLENIQTGKQTVELAYGEMLDKRVIVPRSTIANANKIINLAEYGIEVTSDTGRTLMQYLNACLVENARLKLTPERSTSKMGWLKDGYGKYLTTKDGDSSARTFAPYNGNIACDLATMDGVRGYFDALNAPAGTLDEWREKMRPLRDRDMVIRLLLDVSLASVLIEPCDALPFVVHLWGGTGNGKSVTLTLAASIWGNPAFGSGLVRSMNSTYASIMATAEFLNNLPFFGDELQTLADKYHGDFDGLIYQLCEGIRKGRLNSDATMQPGGSWKCAFLFTGEQPILNTASRAGARNRVVELQLNHALFNTGEDAAEAEKIVSFFAQHYGTAGRAFIAGLSSLPSDKIKQDYRDLLNALHDISNATGKQLSLGALILLADSYAEQFIWGEDGNCISLEDIAPYLKSETDTDTALAAFEATMNLITANQQNFLYGVNSTPQTSGPIWGKIDEPVKNVQTVKIIKDQLESELRKQGYNLASVLHEWSERNWLQRHPRKIGNRETLAYTKNVKIRATPANCLWLNIPVKSDE